MFNQNKASKHEPPRLHWFLSQHLIRIGCHFLIWPLTVYMISSPFETQEAISVTVLEEKSTPFIMKAANESSPNQTPGRTWCNLRSQLQGHSPFFSSWAFNNARLGMSINGLWNPDKNVSFYIYKHSVPHNTVCTVCHLGLSRGTLLLKIEFKTFMKWNIYGLL